jgi:hypothetical protein
MGRPIRMGGSMGMSRKVKIARTLAITHVFNHAPDMELSVRSASPDLLEKKRKPYLHRRDLNGPK